jgi:hypothetical protein
VTWGGGLGGASGAVPNAIKQVADSKASGDGTRLQNFGGATSAAWPGRGAADQDR